jgi:hypothetical protein
MRVRVPLRAPLSDLNATFMLDLLTKAAFAAVQRPHLDLNSIQPAFKKIKINNKLQTLGQQNRIAHQSWHQKCRFVVVCGQPRRHTRSQKLREDLYA